MISSHIAHDCHVGNNVIIANNVPLGGHAIIEDNVVIGGNSAVQQFTRIGKMAMIGGMTGVLHDVIPYGLSTGNRNSLQGLNLIGLRRAKFENKDILGLSNAYKEIFATKNINKYSRSNYKKNINVNCISPGFIKTAMTDKLDEKFKELIISKIPSARLGEPTDIANAVLFLASDQSNYINGETIHVNGGMYMA